MTPWMLYGANGFTGELIAEEAHRRGMRPVVAGRRADAVEAVAARFGFAHRAFALDDLAAQLRATGARALLLAAGPFAATSGTAAAQCLAAGVDYLDVTGELDVFERLFDASPRARARGVMLLPGVGHDVVPSDCLAACLKEALPDATALDLALASDGTFSRGTARTMRENPWKAGTVRRDGRLVTEALGPPMEVPFRDRPRRALLAPWGDLATAWRSTGVPDIRFRLALSPAALRSLVRDDAPGPGAGVRATARCHFWGRATAADGRRVEATLETPEGYALTAAAAVESVRRVLAGRRAPGTTTPSLAFGARFVTELPGCDLRVGGVS